jgi:hypothetical protein
MQESIEDEERRLASELADLDAKYHDHLPPDTNCPLCGVEHAAIHPELLADR